MSGRAGVAFAACALSIACISHAQQFELVEATIDDVHAAFDAGTLTCEDLVDGYLARIDAYDQRGPELNSIKLINPNARDEAEALDAAFESDGLVGPLHCVPVLLKDQVETRDMPTTYGSAVFEGFVSGRDATIVERMSDAGAIILAKTNMGEYAFSYVGSSFGMVRNAYDPTRLPSGSSAGTGAAV
ncbi:MAG: amidase, partial [Gammaproteobacteria bacterium]|nr:amidase [Gammaproteobacteria bacterium]